MSKALTSRPVLHVCQLILRALGWCGFSLHGLFQGGRGWAVLLGIFGLFPPQGVSAQISFFEALECPRIGAFPTDSTVQGLVADNVKSVSGDDGGWSGGAGDAGPWPLFVSLEEALDSPDLFFSVGGAPAWEGVAEGQEDKARVSQVLPGGSARLETLVTGPGLLSYRTSPGVAFGMDGAKEQETPYWMGLSQRQFREIPAGLHRVRWLVSVDPHAGSNAGKSAEMDDVAWRPYQAEPWSSWGAGQGFSLTASDHEWSCVAGPDLDGGGSLHPMVSGTGPAWVEGVFTGPGMLVFSTYQSGGGVVTVDGTARSLNLTARTPAADWNPCQIAIPSGSHAVRWTVRDTQPMFFLDGLRLVASAGSLGEAAELPAGASVGPNEKRFWLPVQEASLADGDALMCEGGFDFQFPDESVVLNIPIAGPARATFRYKGNWVPKLAVDGTFESPFPTGFAAVWTDEPDGWKRGTVDILPGSHGLSLFQTSMEPFILNEMEITRPMRIWQAGEAAPVPGAVFTTNPANPFLGSTPVTGTPPVTLVGCSQPGGPDVWLEMRVAGPGVARFQFREHYRDGIKPNPRAALRLAVDGTVLPAPVHGSTTLIDSGLSTPDIYAVCLSAGEHVLRWTINTTAGGSPGTYELSGFSFTSGPALWSPPAGACGAFLCMERVPLQIRQEEGPPILRLGTGGTDLYSDNEKNHSLLTWSNPVPGTWKFRWRPVPGSAPWPTQCIPDFRTTMKFESAVGGGGLPIADWDVMLRRDGRPDWQTAEVAMPFAGVQAAWRLPRVIPGIEISGFSFHPWEAIPLSEAMGIPEAVVSTDPANPWRGFRDADGNKFCIPPYMSESVHYSIGTPAAARTGWLSMVLYGPGLIQWSRTAAGDGMDGMRPVLMDGIVRNPPFILRGGPHTLTWAGWEWSLKETMRLYNVFSQPLSSAYADWAPPLNGTPIPPGMMLPDEDYDGDGQSNALEYAFRTDPFISNSPPSPALHRDEGSIFVSMPETRTPGEGVRIRLETSPDLKFWGETESEIVLPADPGKARRRLLLPAVPERVFVRARVELVDGKP